MATFRIEIELGNEAASLTDDCREIIRSRVLPYLAKWEGRELAATFGLAVVPLHDANGNRVGEMFVD